MFAARVALDKRFCSRDGGTSEARQSVHMGSSRRVPGHNRCLGERVYADFLIISFYNVRVRVFYRLKCRPRVGCGKPRGLSEDMHLPLHWPCACMHSPAAAQYCACSLSSHSAVAYVLQRNAKYDWQPGLPAWLTCVSQHTRDTRAHLTQHMASCIRRVTTVVPLGSSCSTSECNKPYHVVLDCLLICTCLGRPPVAIGAPKNRSRIMP